MDNERLILPIGLKSTVEGVGMNESVDHNEAAAWLGRLMQGFAVPSSRISYIRGTRSMAVCQACNKEAEHPEYLGRLFCEIRVMAFGHQQ